MTVIVFFLVLQLPDIECHSCGARSVEASFTWSREVISFT